MFFQKIITDFFSGISDVLIGSIWKSILKSIHLNPETGFNFLLKSIQLISLIGPILREAFTQLLRLIHFNLMVVYSIHEALAILVSDYLNYKREYDSTPDNSDIEHNSYSFNKKSQEAGM